MPQTAIETVQLYELLKPKLGEQESRSLLGFIEERTIHLVQDEIAKGLVTRSDLNAVRDELSQEIAGIRQELAEIKQDLAEVHKEIARLDQRITTEIARLEKEFLAFQWQTRLYFLIIALLILLTNPGVLELVSRLLGLSRP